MNEDVKTYAIKSILATNIRGETIAQSYNLSKLLENLNKNIEILKTTGHPKWKEVDFIFEGLNWDIYLGSQEIFIDK